MCGFGTTTTAYKNIPRTRLPPADAAVGQDGTIEALPQLRAPCHVISNRRGASGGAAVFGPGRGCSDVATATSGDVIFGSIVEDVLPPVWRLLTSTILPPNLLHLCPIVAVIK